MAAHIRKHSAERDGGAHGRERVFGLHQKRRRRLVADALECGKDLDDGAAALVERFSQGGFLDIERFEARARRLNARLDLAHAGGGVDQLLIERAPILADHFDFAPELRLIFGRSPFVRADRIEFLVALLDGFGISLRHGRGSGGRWRWGLDLRRRDLRRRDLSHGTLRWNLGCRRRACWPLADRKLARAGGNLRRRVLRKGIPLAAECQCESQCESHDRAQYEARIAMAQAAGNHAVQG
ncbi:MAG: hypothetical protein ACLPXW_03175 [Xanthobacteraceae bacterium]